MNFYFSVLFAYMKLKALKTLSNVNRDGISKNYRHTHIYERVFCFIYKSCVKTTNK